MLSPGQIAPPIRHVVRTLRQRARGARRGDRLRSRRPRRPRLGPRRPAPDRAALRQPDRRRRRQPVVLRPRRVRPPRAGHEDDRRRPGAPPALLRRLRDGRDGDRPDRARPLAHDRRRRRRSDRRGAGRAGPRAGDALAARRVPQRRSERRSACCCSTAASEPLATFGDRLSGKATKELERLGVELRMGSRVVGVDANGVDVVGADGANTRIDAYTTVWAAGVQASPLAGQLAEASGATLDRAGRIAVADDLTIPGHPEVFAIGDMATVHGLPGVAEVAMQGGLHAANTIARRLKGEERVALQVPGHGQRGDHRTLPRHRQRAQGAPQRVPRLGGVVLRPPRLPHRLRQSAARRCCAGCARCSGAGAAEREFSIAHIGGDLSLPAPVRAIVQPNLYPAAPAGVGTDEE